MTSRIRSHSSIGQKIKAVMNKKGFTNQDLAEAVGLSAQRIDIITKSEDMKVSTLMRVAKQLDVPCGEILDR